MDLVYCTGIGLLELAALQPLTAWPSSIGFRTFISLFLVQYISLKIYRLVIYPAFFSPLRHLPGPQDNTILLGQEVKKFKAETPITLQLQWSRTWPDSPFIRYLSIAGRESLLTNNLAAHKAVLQTQCYDFIKPQFFARLAGEIAGQGLLFAVGDEHKHERRLLAGPFSIPNIRKLLPIFQRKANELSAVFEVELGSKSHGSIEVTSLLAKVAMDIIGVTILGIELGEMSSDTGHGFQELYERLLHQGTLGQLIWVLNSFIPIRRFLPIEANQRFIQAKTEIRVMLSNIIQQRIREIGGGEMKESRDVLTYMLEEARQYQIETGKQAWTEDDIVGHLLNFTSAGHETSAGTVCWALYVLATNQDVQNKLRQEIVQGLLQQSPKPGFDETSSLPYLHNFVREVLRVYGPSIMAPREAARDLVIEGVHIPKGTQIDIHMAIMHRREDVWGEDAAVFNPDRWDELTGDAASPYAWLAFIQGPRMCPGKNFSMTEIKAILVELVSRWRFVGIEKNDGSGELLTDGEEMVGRGVKIANPSLTYCPSGGLRVRFQRL